VLDRSGLDPARLILEITETALVTEVSEMVRILGQLKHLGVQLAVDDFGTGQSSLAHLARYPVDLLKIDRSFFGDGRDPSSRRLLQASVELGRRLGLSVVAEGMETEQQAAMLPRMRGVFAQGYLYSRPLKVDAASALLEAQATAQSAAWGCRGGRVAVGRPSRSSSPSAHLRGTATKCRAGAATRPLRSLRGSRAAN
jgi:EAL domain-containing protein (putative c-di-GMP-specific phosphodiesterase class I)